MEKETRMRTNISTINRKIERLAREIKGLKERQRKIAGRLSNVNGLEIKAKYETHKSGTPTLPQLFKGK